MNDKILTGPPYHTAVPKESLGKVFYKGLTEHGGQVAFIDEFTEESVTYDEMLETSRKLALIYKKLNLKKGDVIGIYSENGINYFTPMIAALYLGITTVPISYYYLQDELHHALELTTPKILFCSKRNYRQFLTTKFKYPFVEHLVVLDNEILPDGQDNVKSFIKKLLTDNDDWEGFKPMDFDIEKTIALIMFSSGTTGLPKGVMLTHKNFLCRMVQCWDPRLKYYDLNDASLGILPFFHASGMSVYTGAMMLGNPTRVFWKFDERVFLGALEKYKISLFGAVPPIIFFLAKSPLVDEYDLSSLKEIVYGSAPVRREIEEALTKRLNVDYLRQVYGMTEATLMVTCVPAGVNKFGSVGKLVPGMSAAIRDVETGRLLGPGAVGEVVLKGDLIMAGYYKNRRATDEIFLPDGFMRSGDLGYYDADGFFYIVDRLKELIKYKGFQVAPAELESLILKHPKVMDVGVVGLPDDAAGELPLAFVVARPDVELTVGEIVEYVARNVSHQKRLRGGVRFVDQIPKNPSGKILRKNLRAMLANKSKL